MGSDVIYSWWILVFVFVALTLILSFAQALVNLIHPPYVESDRKEMKSVYLYQASRSRGGGSYTKFDFILTKGRWKYRINSERLRNWLLFAFAIGVITFIYFSVKGFSVLATIQILLLFSSAFVVPAILPVIFACSELKNNDKNVP